MKSMFGCGLALGVLAIAPFALAQDRGERREAGAHEHGAAALSIAVDGADLVVELATPFYNLVGFERAPKAPEEIKAWMDAAAAARAPGRILALPPEAGCRLSRSSLGVLGGELPDARDAEHAAHDHGHDHDHGEGDGSGAFHDILLSWTFRCASIEKASWFEATAFGTFPRLTRLDTAYLDARTQAADSLTRASPRWKVK